MRLCAVILTILIIFALYVLLQKKNIEKFTALTGMQSPLTTYDDYGTFNFMFHFNDLPYDTTKKPSKIEEYLYKSESDLIKPEPINNNLDFDHDNFIRVGNNTVRRKLVPHNYSNPAYANFTKQSDQLITRSPIQAPKPQNYYF